MSSSAQYKSIHIGSCLCGAIRYEVNGELREVVNCHCSLCQKFHGHYGAYTAAKREDVKITNNNDLLVWYRSMKNSARRGFCVICGSSLFWDLDGATTISIAAGTLDQPTDLRTAKDIYIAEKGDYYCLGPQLEKFERGL